MTQHLGTEDTMRVLQHFSDGGRYLLISNYPHVRRNTQLNVKQVYRFRQQNFNLGPYNLIDPLCEDEEMGGCVTTCTTFLCVNGSIKLYQGIMMCCTGET